MSTLSDPMDWSMPGFSDLHCLPVCLNICPLSQWCYWTLFSFWLQSVPALESFPMSQPFPSSGQNTGASFSFSISPSNEYSWLISFRMYWYDLLAVQGTHKGLLQHHNSKASTLWRSAFFMVQFSHPYMTTGKNIKVLKENNLGDTNQC